MKIKQRTYNRLFNTYKYTGCGILFSHLKFLFSLHAVLYFAYDSSKGKPKKYFFLLFYLLKFYFKYTASRLSSSKK